MIDIWTVEDAGPEALKTEARRIADLGGDTDKPVGLYTEDFDILCPGTAKDVLQRARAVMGIVNEIGMSGPWPTDAEWSCLLPSWFVEACEPEDTEDRGEDMLRHEMPAEERRALYCALKWKLTEWTSWMEPCERVWMWWRADLRDAKNIRVVVDRLGDPTPGDPPGLWWLFSAAGATEIDEPMPPRVSP